MSEEEIIEKIKNTIQYDKEHRIVTIYDEKPLFRDYLQGLLDLYQKEKEKNKEYEKLHLTEYKLEPDGNLLSKTIELDDYISKDKIREKIKIKKEEKAESTDSNEAKLILREIYVLKELLKGETNK